MYSLLLDSNAAFVCLVSGIFGVYWGLWKPGWIVPGVVGLGLAAVGSYGLYRLGPNPFALLLLAFSIPLLLLEVFWNDRYAGGALATVLLGWGFSILFPEGRRIHPLLAMLLSLILGVVTTRMATTARRSRFAKRNDALRP
jgi:membrane-bound ClpP family serine protease